MKALQTRTVVTLAIVLVAACALIFAQSPLNIFPQLIHSIAQQADRKAFPDIDTSILSEKQTRIVEILRTEYTLNAEGTKYSDGVEEAWCADFASWVMKEAGHPYTNPHSNYWRIPGTKTLKEYYQASGSFEAAGSNYIPQVGDTLLYDNPSIFGQHVHFVIAFDGEKVTTVGGNEGGEIRLQTHRAYAEPGFIGYGKV